MNVKMIVKQHLKDKGYDGLYLAGECSCRLEELFPCLEDIRECEAGYEHEDNTGEFDFIIAGYKPEDETPE